MLAMERLAARPLGLKKRIAARPRIGERNPLPFVALVAAPPFRSKLLRIETTAMHEHIYPHHPPDVPVGLAGQTCRRAAHHMQELRMGARKLRGRRGR